MMVPRVLVVGNQCFSESTSNGRTLGTLFKGWPHDKIRQFCISLQNPDTSVCSNYFSVSDKNAFTAFLTFGLYKKHSNKAISMEETNNASLSLRKVQKTAISLLARNIVWESGFWKGRTFNAWLEEFGPEIVVFQSGDSAFMANLARKIAGRFNAKLLIFNTEGYVFFDHNYLGKHWSDRFAFPLFKKWYRHSFYKAFDASVFSVYLNGRLEEDYQSIKPHNSAVIYNSSEMWFSPSTELKNPPTFAYLGNLGIRRTDALVEFAEVLRKIAPDCHIDVYGKLPANYDGIFDITSGIRFHGMVSYEKVKKIISVTDFLIHVEKDDPILRKELRYAFSTKIADSICSGRNFIIYAPESLACAHYISETGAGWFASSKDELENVLKTALSDIATRKEVIDKARIAAIDNHSAITNRTRFKRILCSLCQNR